MPAFPWSGLLSDSRIVKAGPSLKHDLHALKQVFLFEEKNILDHGHVARASGSGQTGVRNLAGFYLGFRIPKSTKTPNWVVRELSPAQITYAATDAWGYRESYLEFERQGMVRQS